MLMTLAWGFDIIHYIEIKKRKTENTYYYVL